MWVRVHIESVLSYSKLRVRWVMGNPRHHVAKESPPVVAALVASLHVETACADVEYIQLRFDRPGCIDRVHDNGVRGQVRRDVTTNSLVDIVVLSEP